MCPATGKEAKYRDGSEVQCILWFCGFGQACDTARKYSLHGETVSVPHFLPCRKKQVKQFRVLTNMPGCDKGRPTCRPWRSSTQMQSASAWMLNHWACQVKINCTTENNSLFLLSINSITSAVAVRVKTSTPLEACILMSWNMRFGFCSLLCLACILEALRNSLSKARNASMTVSKTFSATNHGGGTKGNA